MREKYSPPSKIKLMDGLALLSENEMRDFIRFAKSPFFSGKRDYTKILSALKKLHSVNFNGMSNSELIDHLSRKLLVSKPTLQRRISEIFKIFEKFLLNIFLKERTLLSDGLLLDALVDRKEYKLANLLSGRIERKKKPKLSSGILREITNIRYLESYIKFIMDSHSEYVKSLMLLTQYKLASFFTDILSISIDNILIKNSGLEMDFSKVNRMLKNIEITSLIEELKSNEPVLYKYVMLHLTTYNCLSNLSDSSSFFESLGYRKEISEYISDKDNHRFFMYFIEYSIIQINFSKQEFEKIVFEIIKEKLELGFDLELRENNYPINNFRDYVIIALKVNEIEWARDFIKKYGKIIPVEFRNDDITLALARVFQTEGKFEESMEKLEKMKVSNYVHYIDRANLRLRSYFEIGKISDLIEEVEGLKQYMKIHNEIPQFTINRQKDIIYYLILLTRYTEGSYDINDLRFKLKNKNIRKFKFWVTDKLADIIENR